MNKCGSLSTGVVDNNTNLTNGVRERSCAPFFYADQAAHYHYFIAEIEE